MEDVEPSSNDVGADGVGQYASVRLLLPQVKGYTISVLESLVSNLEGGFIEIFKGSEAENTSMTKNFSLLYIPSSIL